MGLLLAIIVIIGIIFTVFDINQKDKIKREHGKKEIKINKLIWELNDFVVSQKLVTPHLEKAICIDETNKKIGIIDSASDKKYIFEYRDILESEIIEDGNTVSNTSRTSQIGGAIIGGVLAGGVGAIIGGLSGESTSQQEIKRVDLKIVVDNTTNPVHIINFLFEPIGIKKSSYKYKEASKEITHWHSLISVIIRQAEDIKNTEARNENSTVYSTSIVEELRKLSELLSDGAITDSEYNQIKATILSKNMK
ncbi:SHOCT domain-containing protein [Solibacillus sp. FSL K6-1554]|uniref:SHOCT domain-containing protein n=1 Tax=Solibacillus sp. FSL K6-1554 TaxID=2921472 RepID=UPI0030F4EE59